MNQKDERTWGILVHLGGIIGMTILPLRVVNNIIGVLILWLIKRNESTFVDEQGKEAINFQISVSIANVLVTLIVNINNGFWGNFWGPGWGGIDFALSWGGLLGVIWLINITFSIIAAVKASKGESYKYPLSLRLVK